MKKTDFLSFLFLILLFGSPKVYAQYCTPGYDVAGCALGDEIDDFSILDSGGNTVFSHLGTGCSSNAYGDYTSDPTLEIELNAGGDYDFTITHDSRNTDNGVTIWIDFNQNEVFDDLGEEVFASLTPSPDPKILQGSFSIPKNIIGVVTTRMRVVITSRQTSADPCTPPTILGEAHDYKVTIIGENQDCLRPSSLTLDSISGTDVSLSWDTVPTATDGYSWKIMNEGDDPDADTPVDSSTVSAGVDTLTITSLTKGSKYDFYLRSECGASAGQSIWQELSFYAAGPGVDCSLPKEISNLPYSDSDNTKEHVNVYSGNPGDSCGVEEDYLNGYDVVYRYQADDDYLINIELDSFSKSYSGVFVYRDCADIGNECAAAGSAVEDDTAPHGFDILVDSGEDYYIVVSSAMPTESFEYELNISGYGCDDIPAPSGEARPYFMTGDALSVLEVEGSLFNDKFKWYKDLGLTSEVTDLGDEPLVDGETYYVTQTVMGCEGDALAITPREFECSVLDPEVITEGVGLCVPGGNVILKTELSLAGDQVYWYESEISDVSIAEGEEFDIGLVSETVSYWVTEARLSGGYVGGQGKIEPSTTFSTGGTRNYGLEFDADEDFILRSVDVYPDDGESGTIEISLFDSSDQLIDSASKSISSASTASSDPVTIVLDFKIEEGQGYRLLQTSDPVLSLKRDSSSYNDYPYELGDNGEYGSITTGTQRNGSTSGSYYYFYNWVVGMEDILCESDRIEIVVEVSDSISDAPEVDATYVFCGEDDFMLDDIEVDGSRLQWYDSFGNELSGETKVEDGVTYSVVDISEICISQMADVRVVIRDYSELPIADEEQVFVEGDLLSSLNVNGVDLRWYSDSDKEEELDGSVVLKDNETYYVTQTRSGFCESEVLGITVTMTLGIEEVVFERLKYAPNPVVDVLHITNNQEIDHVEVFDLTGRKISGMVELLGKEVTVNYSEFSPGVYLIRVNIANKFKIIKVVKI